MHQRDMTVGKVEIGLRVEENTGTKMSLFSEASRHLW